MHKTKDCSEIKGVTTKTGIFMRKATQVKVGSSWLLKWIKKWLESISLLINHSPLCLKRLKLNCVLIRIFKSSVLW